MGRTFIRQATQIRNSDDYDDTLGAGTTLESGPTTIEGDLNGLRSQVKRAIWADSAGNWYDDIQTVNAKKRGITALNTDLDDLEEKRILFRVDKLTDITVGAGNNFVVLSVAGSEGPAETAAVGAGTALGAIVALLPGASGTHSLNEVTGPNPLSPKNLLLIREASSGDDILSSGRRIYGLLQAESIVVNGDTFDDTTKQVQISFVRPNATGDDLEAVPSADIAGQSINYSYVRRVRFDDVPESAFLTGHFVDAAAATAVTLDNAIDNQVGAATQAQDIDWRISDNFTLDYQDSTGGVNLLRIAPAAAGDEIEINIDILDINNAQDADFLNGAIFDSGGTPIRVGSTTGYIDTASADLGIRAGGELFLDDSNQAGSTWTQTAGIKLSDSTAEWDAVEAAYGSELSILAMLGQAKRRAKVYAVVTAQTSANTDVGGVGGGSNLDTQLPDMSVGNFLTDYDVYVNGELQRPGSTSGDDHDYYPGTSLANGQIRLEYVVRPGDQLCVVPFAR